MYRWRCLIATVAELLTPQVIFDDITNRIRVPQDILQRFLGVQMGGPNVRNVPTRYGAYDIFDMVREVGTANAPNTPATRINARPVAQQPVTLIRKNEAVPLYYDQLHNVREMGKPSANIDEGGARYLERQEKALKQRVTAFREFITASVFRGNVYFSQTGDLLNPSFSSSGSMFNINQQIPANNLNQLNGTITTSWANTAAATIFEDVLAVDALMLNLTGYPLKHCWCTSVMWSNITGNSGMRARAGTANVTFEKFSGMGELPSNKEEAAAERTGILRPLPDIIWHIYDGCLDLNGTTTKILSDTMVSFFPPVGNDWIEGLQGAEFVVEGENAPAISRQAPYFWPWYYRDPPRIEIVSMDLFTACVRVPKAVMCATTVF